MNKIIYCLNKLEQVQVSDDSEAFFSIGVSSCKATFSYIWSNHEFIKSICEWGVDIVVDTTLVVETSWLPKLWHIVGWVVVVKNELTEVAY